MALPSKNPTSSPQIPTPSSPSPSPSSQQQNQYYHHLSSNPYPPRGYPIGFRPRSPFGFSNNPLTRPPHFNNKNNMQNNYNNSMSNSNNNNNTISMNMNSLSNNNSGRILGPIVSFGRGISGQPAPLPAYHYSNKVVPSLASAHDGNGYRDPRVKNDSFLTVRDRKVKVSGNSSLYAACRSWLRNGFSLETQPHYLDGMNSLPEPSPPPVPDAHSPAEQEPNNEEEEEGSVDHLSSSDLLQRHIKRAKRVRARLREERLQRIARYKTRLAFLIPPLVEQHQFRNEAAGRN